MENPAKQIQHKKKKDNRIQTVYSRCMLTRKIVLPISTIGKTLKENIEENIKSTIEGRCVVEGYVKPHSSKIVTYSSGIIQRGNNIAFEVVFECDVCFPVEGMIITCVAKNITKAGIRAESANDIPSPIIVFLAKDHHFNSTQFAEVQEGDKINVRVIGQRFELNDKYISIIAELVKEKEVPFMMQKEKKPRIVIEDE
jgi:DNA-directed RNA polymerase subunit E'/Rpb7